MREIIKIGSEIKAYNPKTHKNMVKSIKLKLLKIKYNGDSIGDDIRAEIEICDILMRARRGDGESIGILEVID